MNKIILLYMKNVHHVSSGFQAVWNKENIATYHIDTQRFGSIMSLGPKFYYIRKVCLCDTQINYKLCVRKMKYFTNMIKIILIIRESPETLLSNLQYVVCNFYHIKTLDR